jgi:hypothetical protein
MLGGGSLGHVRAEALVEVQEGGNRNAADKECNDDRE